MLTSPHIRHRPHRPLAFLLFAACLVAFSPTAPAAQETPDFLVIAHPEVQETSISKRKVSQLLLKEIQRWEGGQLAQPVDLDSKSPIRDTFSRTVHGRSVASIKNYWLRQIFSGSAEPPPEVHDDSAMISYVRSHPGAIGYVSASAKPRGVKVLEIAP